MQFTLNTALTVAGLAGSALAQSSGSTSITPHQQYSSSVGVLGCKINTNRVAYWPGNVDCNNYCVEVTSNGRTLHLLKIDSSGGAHDISYDAWNYLSTGKGAAEDPTMGGGIPATWKYVDPAMCDDLIYTADKSMPFSAANSMNFVSSCSANTHIGAHHSLWNIATMACTYGVNEECHLPTFAGANTPTCPHQLGLTPMPPTVFDLQYGTGKKVPAV